MKKNFLVATAVTLLILILLCSLWYFKSIATNKDTNKDQNNNSSDNKYNFSLETNYIEDNQWEYTVKGELPNPCYNVNVQEVIMESYPEQVNILVEVKEPGEDAICIQVIDKYLHNGTFSASENAQISLKIE